MVCCGEHTPASGPGILIFMTRIVDADRRATAVEKELGFWTLQGPYSLNSSNKRN